MNALSPRQNQILEQLELCNGTLSSNDLAEHFVVSVQTIRRDMNELSDQGLVQRVHGGITLPRHNRNLTFNNRNELNLSAKLAIARSVASDIPQGSSVLLGIGTTPARIAQAMAKHPGAQVITNNLQAALALTANPAIEILFAGGRIRSSDQDCCGEDTLAFFDRFQADIAIFGVGGISADGELMDFSLEESAITRTLVNRSHQKWLVADQSKYLRSAPVRSATLDDIDRFYLDTLLPPLATLCQHHALHPTLCNDPAGEHTHESA